MNWAFDLSNVTATAGHRRPNVLMISAVCGRAPPDKPPSPFPSCVVKPPELSQESLSLIKTGTPANAAEAEQSTRVRNRLVMPADRQNAERALRRERPLRSGDCRSRLERVRTVGSGVNSEVAA